MNFKKKLFMMSLAASMVVPSNLALVASVATPILADNEDDFEIIKKLIEQAKIPNEILKFLNVTFDENGDITDCGGISLVTSGSKKIQVKSGEYKLTDDIVNEEGTLNLGDFFISLESNDPNVTIDLAEHTITSSADKVFTVVCGTLTLNGGGKVKCTSSAINAAVVEVDGLSGSGSPAVANIQKNVILEAPSNGLGIYQIRNSVVTLTDCVVKGRTGVEIQSGKLIVSGGEITSTSTDLKVKDCGDGIYTTYGAAIAVAPYDPNWPQVITATVNINGGATLNGKAGLVLIDPRKEIFKNDSTDRSVSLQVNKNTQFGSSNTYNIGYTEAMKEFVDKIELNTSKFHRLKYDNTNNNSWTLVKDATSFNNNSNINVSLAESLSYTGKELKPKVTVTDGSNTLDPDTDYIVEYENNTNAGTATVIVKGIRDYTGEVTQTFEITPASINNATLTGLSNSYNYTGQGITPAVTVTLNGTTLTKDKDYTVSYSNNTEIGTGTVTITGKGNYEGTVTKTFAIVETIKDSNVTLASNSYAFTGQAISPSVSVTVGTKTLGEGTDYEVTYSNNVQAGTAKVTVAGKGDYTGTVEKSFTINPAPINEATVTVNPSVSTYTGTAIEPTVTVTLGDKTLTKGTDYTVTYGSNTALGQATVTVTGKGNYTGTATGNFTITEASIAQAEITGLSESYNYTGVAIEPTLTVNVNGKTLVKDTDYTLAYENNINLGTATITVTGIGNYTGTARATFEIEKPTIRDWDITLSDGPYTLDNGKCEPGVIVVVNGKTLIEGTDYEVTYVNSDKNGRATVIVTGKGNYKGNASKEYQIVRKTFTSDDVHLAPGPYLISKNNFAPEVKVVGLSEDNYYIIYSFPVDEDGNVIAGEATVTVTGKGDYAGCVQLKNYLILDDRDGTLDLSFTAGDDETPVHLSVPLEKLQKDENGKPIVTDDTLSVAMTNGSKAVTKKETPDCRPVAPDYIIKVTGINSVDDLKPKTNVIVETNSSSAVKFNFRGASKDPNPSISINFPNVSEEESEVSVLADEPVAFEAAEEDRVIYEQLKNIDINRDEIIEKEEMENYISKYPQYRDVYVPDDFRQDFREPLQLGVDVYLDKDGFIEIEIPNTSTTDTKPSDSSSHKPTTPKPTPITPEEPMVPVVGNPTTMYRLYNRLTGEHLYTTDKAERDQLLTSDTWKDEGQGWIAPEVSDYPVYRLLNPNTGDHHYTTDENEYTTLQTLGWVGEDIAFYSADKDDSENVILHRLYNPNAQETGMHHYTTDENERETLVSKGWVYEGTAWAGLKSK